MIPLPNCVWRHLHISLSYLPVPLMMILLPNRVWGHLRVRVFHTLLPNQQTIVFTRQIPNNRKCPSRNKNGPTRKLGNLSTRRLWPLLIKFPGIFKLHPNVEFLPLPEIVPLRLPPIAPLSTIPFSKANIWMPWGRPYLLPQLLARNPFTITNIHLDPFP
jgi:hypothetical protein